MLASRRQGRYGTTVSRSRVVAFNSEDFGDPLDTRCSTETSSAHSDDVYAEKMKQILSAVPCYGVPPEPSVISTGVYLGSSADAENLAMLKAWKITYLLNCDGGSYIRFKRLREKYGPQSGVQGYEELPIEDFEGADVRSYFDRAHGFINFARARNARVLIYCPGVSRSGAIAISYLLSLGQPLLEATKQIKEKRRVVLSNDGYIQQLIMYARERALLEGDVCHLNTPKYYTPLNSYRIKTAHLPASFML